MARDTRNQAEYGRKKKKKTNRKKRQQRKIILAILAVILALIGLAAAYAWSKFGKMGRIDIKDKDVKINDMSVDTQKTLEGYDNIALFGLDNRSTGNFERGNSDTIIVVSINKKSGEIRMASVYRDTYLDIGDNTFRKANAAYAMGGPEQAVRMLNTNLDLDIQEYVSFDFSAVAEAVDILGGVEIEVTDEECVHLNNYCIETSEVTGKSYDPLPGGGTYNLNGVQAVSYGRIRYTAGDDFKRTERQRLVVNKMVEKALKSNVGTINDLIDAVFPKIKTSLGKSELIAMAMDAFNYKLGESQGFPSELRNEVVSISYQQSDADCVIPKDLASNVKQLHDFLYGTTGYNVTDSVQGISDEIVYRTGVTAEGSE